MPKSITYGEYDIRTAREGKNFIAFVDHADCNVTGRGFFPSDALHDLAEKLEQWEDEHFGELVETMAERKHHGR